MNEVKKELGFVANRSCLYDGALEYIEEIYDSVEPHTIDVETIRRLIGKKRLNILEAFCGHGRILLPLSMDGHEVTGIDLSETFLGILKKKVTQLPDKIRKKITLIKGDAVSGNYPNGFDLVILGGNCLYELGSPEEQKACIQHAANVLKPGGYFWLDCDHQEGDLRKEWQDIGVVRLNAFPSGSCRDGTIVKSTKEIVWFDASKRLVRERRKTVVERNGKVIHEQEFTVQTHAPSVVEMRDWLLESNLEIVNHWGNHSKNLPYTDESARSTFWAIKR